MAFTSLNSFLLSTDGRVFSWGAIHYCLGRTLSQSDKAMAIPVGPDNALQDLHTQAVDIGEIDFGEINPIVMIATGRSHVLALDTKGKVWSWGTNDKGQLGHPVEDTSVKDKPVMVKKLKNIVQVYCGEYQSFAVDNTGEIYAWGLNKNNCLLVNQIEQGFVKTIVYEPMPVCLPEYFIRGAMTTQRIVQNNQNGFDFYAAQKPVQPHASKTQEELERVREDHAKMRKKVKDF